MTGDAPPALAGIDEEEDVDDDDDNEMHDENEEVGVSLADTPLEPMATTN